MNSKPTTKPFRIVTCTFSSNLSQNSCIWQLLQLTWSAQWIEHCIWSSQRSEFDFWASSNFFQVPFQPLKLFILLQRSFSLSHLYLWFKIWFISYDSIHNCYILPKLLFGRSTHGPINNCDHLSKTKFVVNVQQSKQNDHGFLLSVHASQSVSSSLPPSWPGMFHWDAPWEAPLIPKSVQHYGSLGNLLGSTAVQGNKN